MSTKIKILHILWSGGIGGMEEYITSLVKYFDQSKYEIYLCFLSKKGEIFDEVMKIDNVIFINIKNRFDVIGALKFVRYLYREKFDIIHSHVRGSYLFAGLLSLFRVPKVLTHHLGPVDSRLYKKIRVFYKLYSRIFQKIIAISNTVREHLINDLGVRDSNRIEVIYNGIDLNKFHKSVSIPPDLYYIKNSDKYILGFVGRMEYFKRPGLFIEIAAEILKKDKNFYFIMAGDGPEMEKCKGMIDHYKIGEYFKLLGFRRDIPNILRLFNALLFTSVGEGLGIVIIEAMAMGVTVFAVNDGAVPEIIRDRENGILLNNTNPKIIAERVIEVLNDSTLINKIKLNAINDVRNRFSIESSVQKTERIYNELLRTQQNV